MARRRVLLTGAAGGVARLLRPGLTDLDGYEVVLTDRVDVPGGVVGDLADPEFVATVTKGIDAIVHLAANPDPASSWDQLRVPNVEVVAAVLGSGVSRIVLASSAHVMGQYVGADRPLVDPDWPVAPCCAYGATKAFAEAMGRAHAYRTGARVVALRLGATTAEPPASSALSSWLGPADLCQLVVRALEADVSYAVCAGVSANTRTTWDLRNPLGYRPVLDSEDYAASVPVDDGWGPCT
ncbi:NAD-dependent epimerase/dehydratase family protein [Actinopolymorpha pittospori]|uniref:Nucleoside-diphosphate-sugar epimerase n=1 Tax=Actinopolymorpha pittospori TaxID=648752 RepID=A0A927RES4_9ACTN|nr:NAD(P)-dependent oxidoreductase [Actinopolymorpha pittospori]MBE1612514.1 nucleoside-diphosphate-sugar epimerase [Actinopolymorpha pittospori]